MTDAALPSVRTRLGEGLVTADEVALFLGVDRSTVYRMAGKELPVVAIGRMRRFRPSDVAACVDSMTRQGQGRSERARRLLSAVRIPRRNELASSRRQSVHPKHERPARNAGATEAAR